MKVRKATREEVETFLEEFGEMEELQRRSDDRRDIILGAIAMFGPDEETATRPSHWQRRGARRRSRRQHVARPNITRRLL